MFCKCNKYNISTRIVRKEKYPDCCPRIVSCHLVVQIIWKHRRRQRFPIWDCGCRVVVIIISFSTPPRICVSSPEAKLSVPLHRNFYSPMRRTNRHLLSSILLFERKCNRRSNSNGIHGRNSSSCNTVVALSLQLTHILFNRNEEKCVFHGGNGEERKKNGNVELFLVQQINSPPFWNCPSAAEGEEINQSIDRGERKGKEKNETRNGDDC